MQNDCYPGSPPEWPKVPLSALAELNPRYPVRKGVDYPFIEMAAVGENFYGILSMETRRLEGSGLAHFRVNDTLFAKITPCPENGKVAFVRALPADVGLGSTEFIVLSPQEGTDPRYLYHLACSHAVRGRAVARMEGSTGRQRVPIDAFDRRLLVPKPSAREQTAIARVLDAVDAATGRTREAYQRSRVAERSLIADAFEGMAAQKRKLGEFTTDVRYGTSQASSERGWGNPVLRIPNVVGDQLSLDDLAYVDLGAADVARLELRDGDLLLVRTNGNPNYIGRSAVFRRPDDRTWVFASYLIRVRLADDLLPEYVNVFLGSERGRRELLRRVTTSAGNHNINSNSIRLLSIPVPQDLDQQRAIADLAKAARQVAVALKARLDALSELKKSLMQDLLTGTVRVDPAIL